jgi:hypothetical protein
MPENQILQFRRSVNSTEYPAEGAPVLSALSKALGRLPAKPGGFSACVSHLQEDSARLPGLGFAVRALQYFRDQLFRAPGREPEMRQLFRESLATACYARSMAKFAQLDAPLLTSAGLMFRLGDVLALRALADAEFCAGQKLQGPVLQEVVAAHNAPLAERALAQWAMGADWNLLLKNLRTASSEASALPEKILAVAEAMGFEHVHLGASTPGYLQAVLDKMLLPTDLIESARSATSNIESLLLRVAPAMGSLKG